MDSRSPNSRLEEVTTSKLPIWKRTKPRLFTADGAFVLSRGRRTCMQDAQPRKIDRVSQRHLWPSEISRGAATRSECSVRRQPHDIDSPTTPSCGAATAGIQKRIRPVPFPSVAAFVNAGSPRVARAKLYFRCASLLSSSSASLRFLNRCSEATASDHRATGPRRFDPPSYFTAKQLTQFRNDLFIRWKAIRIKLAVDKFSTDLHIENSALTSDKFNVDFCIRFFDGGRQTGGLRLVVSLHAVFD